MSCTYIGHVLGQTKYSICNAVRDMDRKTTRLGNDVLFRLCCQSKIISNSFWLWPRVKIATTTTHVNSAII